MKLSPFETYCLFQALKLHFTTESYDFFKYGGKTKATVEQFNGKRDKYFYHRLSKRYNDDQMQDFIVANMLDDAKQWVGHFFDDDADLRYKVYVKNHQSITYTFKSNLDKMCDDSSLASIFHFEDNGFPKMMNDYMRGDATLETLIIINDFTDCFSKFNEKLAGDYLWDKFYFKARKYRPFLKYDKTKIKSIIKEKVQEKVTKYA